MPEDTFFAVFRLIDIQLSGPVTSVEEVLSTTFSFFFGPSPTKTFPASPPFLV